MLFGSYQDILLQSQISNQVHTIFCTGDPEDFVLLTDFLPEDRALRERLKEDQLVSESRE